MAALPSSALQHATALVFRCCLLFVLPARLSCQSFQSLNLDRLVTNTFPPGARILVDEDGTCARARLYEWHMYRETAKSLLENQMFISDDVRDSNWREQLNWWYGLVKDEIAHPPRVIDCPIGRIFFGLLSFAVDFPGDHQLALEEVLVGPWYTNYTVLMFVLSGWPIFSLLSQMTRTYSTAAVGHPATTWCPYQGLLEVISGRGNAVQKFLRASRMRLRLRDSADGLAHKSVQLAIAVAELKGFENAGSGFLLPKPVWTAIAALPSLAEIAGALVSRNSTLSTLLGVVQSWFFMQSSCLPQTRLISARPHNVLQPFRLCVRRKMEGLDAAATLYGEWATCHALRQWHRDFVGPLARESPTGSAANCVVVDVGSHIGLCSLAFAAQGCRVVAIDILAEHAQMILDSAHLNNIKNSQLTVVHAAMSNVDGGWVSVHGPGEGLPAQNTNIGDVVASDGLNLQQRGLAVPRHTVDALLRRLGIEPRTVTMLKVDAEGHDLQILQGARETLLAPRQHRRSLRCDGKRCNKAEGHVAVEPPVVVFECVEKEGGLKIVDYLQDLGMEVTRMNQALNYAVRKHVS